MSTDKPTEPSGAHEAAAEYEQYIPAGYHIVEDADGERLVKNDPPAQAIDFLKERVDAVPFGRWGLNRLPCSLYEEVARVMDEYARHFPASDRERELREALQEALSAIDEAYEATGHFKVAKSSVQRQKILAALSKSP